MNGMMKGAKVGTSSPLKLDIVRRLKTVALVCEAPESATHGLLDALRKYGALLAVIGTREGFREVRKTIEPLTDAVICAKRAIRTRQSLVVTETMMEGLRAIVAWQARSCGAALEGNVYKFLDSKKKEHTELAMLKKAVYLAAMMDYGTTHSPLFSPARSSNTVSASSRSRSSSSICSSPSVDSLNARPFTEPSEQGVVFYPGVELASPGAEVIVARQPLTMLDQLVACLPGGNAIRRWCSRAIDACLSRGRLWM